MNVYEYYIFYHRYPPILKCRNLLLICPLSLLVDLVIFAKENPKSTKTNIPIILRCFYLNELSIYATIFQKKVKRLSSTSD